MHYIREILLHIFLKQILMHIIFCIRKKHVQQACVFRSKKITYRKCEVTLHYVKNVQIRSFFWSMFFLVHSEYKKIWTRKNSVFGHFSRSEISTEYIDQSDGTIYDVVSWIDGEILIVEKNTQKIKISKKGKIKKEMVKWT